MSFTIYPAIDLKDGACVRLVRGDMASATIFNPDPAQQAKRFADAGFSWLHVVDLNGAFAGHSVNASAIRAIRAATSLRLQLGGGIRTRAQIDAWLDAGVTRLILGTAALHDPDLVRAAAREHPGRIAVGIDARDGRVAVNGWSTTGSTRATDLARAYEDAGVATIIFTDIARDGTGQGLNLDETLAVARAATPVPVIASGGVGGIDDVRAARNTNGLISGVICGRALYDGRLDWQAALAEEHAGQR